MKLFTFSGKLLSMKLIIIMSLFLLLSIHTSNAQLIPNERYEKELKSSESGFTIISLSENGLALIREKNKYNDGKRFWEVVLLDSSLLEKWTHDLEVKSSYMMVGYEYEGQTVYFLFREGDKDSNKFIIVTLNIDDHEIKQFEIKHEFLFRLTHFSVVGGNPIFGGYVSREPAVMLYETNSQLLKVIPGFFLQDTELLDLRINYNKTFNALLIERNSLDKRHLAIKTFDETGVLLLEDYIELEKNKYILTGITSSLRHEELIILGTYTEGVGKEALGYYSVLVDPFSDQMIQYFPFTTLNHLLDYLPEKKANRIKSKSQERISAGKNPDYKAYVHPIRIEESDKGFYFLSEMYDPVASNNRPYWNNYNDPYYGYGYSPYSYNPYMNRYTDSPYSFSNNSNNSARMTESVLTLFNNKGKLVWDNSIKFNNIKKYALEQTSDFTVKDNVAYLSYKKENEIFINTSSLLSDPELDTIKIPMSSVNDIVRHESEDDTGYRFWYKNHSYAWGYQSIRNQEKKNEDQVRYVFYINKFKAE